MIARLVPRATIVLLLSLNQSYVHRVFLTLRLDQASVLNVLRIIAVLTLLLSLCLVLRHQPQFQKEVGFVGMNISRYKIIVMVSKAVRGTCSSSVANPISTTTLRPSSVWLAIQANNASMASITSEIAYQGPTMTEADLSVRCVPLAAIALRPQSALVLLARSHSMAGLSASSVLLVISAKMYLVRQSSSVA